MFRTCKLVFQRLLRFFFFLVLQIRPFSCFIFLSLCSRTLSFAVVKVSRNDSVRRSGKRFAAGTPYR